MKENIPQFLHEILLQEYGEAILDNIVDGYSKKRATTFRVNTLKASVEEIKEVLDSLNIKYLSIPWLDIAFILEEEYPIQDLEIYKQGKIYVQSLSSMIPALIVNPKEKENILDMCAAPGRKNYSNGSYVK